MPFISCLKKLFPAAVLIAAMFTAQADDQYDLPVRVVIFPLREAVIPALAESRVMKYHFNEGEKFPSGKILANLDKTVYKQRLLKMDASVKEAKAGLEFTKRNAKRMKDLFAKGMQGHTELERAELEAEIAEAKYLSAQANYIVAERDLALCDISAPFDGRLIEKLVNEFEYVRTGQPLMKIIDDNQLLAVMHLPSGDKNKIKLGQKMKIKIDETGTCHEGEVYKISGVIDPGSRTFEIKALLDNRNGVLSAGMSGALVKDKKNADKKKK
ncbi:MAG: efflux RND transporter periplasmic adaptor subunit [Victivallales bacterium]